MKVSWEGFWRVLDAKLEAKLAKKLIKKPLVGNLAEKANMPNKTSVFQCVWPLGLPTSRATWPKILPKPIRNLSKSDVNKNDQQKKNNRKMQADAGRIWLAP